MRKIFLNLSRHEQTRHSQADTITDTSLDEMSSISMPCVQADDITVDTANAFE